MSIRVIFVCIFSLSAISFGRNVDSRGIFRSGDSGAVNLVEFNIRGVIYGKCSFNDGGEHVSVIFEEKDGEIQAKSDNPTVMDPITKAHLCREAAVKSPDEPALRSGLDLKIEENPEELAKRFAQFEREMALNEEYVYHLRPRFIGLLSALGSSNSYGISFGSTFNASSLPSFGFSLPQNTASQATVGFGFPFKTSIGKKK